MGRKKPENEELAKVDGLTVSEHIFCAEYVANGGNATAAAKKAYPGHVAPEQKGHRLLMDNKIVSALEYHRIPVRDAIAALAPEMIQRIRDLARQERNPKVAYMASRDLMDRAGFKEAERTEQHITIRLEVPWRPGGEDTCIDVTPTHKSFLPEPDTD